MLVDQNILVISAHSDDGIIGCGGFISKYIKSNNVFYLAFTNSMGGGDRSEMDNALKELGVKNCELVDYFGYEDKIYRIHDREYHECRQAILDKMVSLKKIIKPSIVLCPSSYDTHQDHEVIRKEVFRAFKDITIMGYEFPWNNREFRTDCFVELSEEDIVNKIRSIKCFKSQEFRKYVGQAEVYIHSMAVTRGFQIHKSLAETFEVIRMLI